MKNSEINIRDPFVLTWHGKYYLYGTRGASCWGKSEGLAKGFDVYTGTDLENWDGPFICFENDGSFWADRNYWAPEVHEWKGKFYMFASFKAEGVCRGTAILEADTPMGPFKPHSDGPVTPRDWACLDGTFYIDEAGKPYIVFCHEWVQVHNGEVCAMALSDDLRQAISEPRLLFKATDAEWVRSAGNDDYITDGPFLWRTKNGRLLCLWASASESGYTEGIAESDDGTLNGRFEQKTPLFDQDGGHGMLFRTMDGRLMLTLHSPNRRTLERPAFYEIVETDAGLRVL